MDVVAKFKEFSVAFGLRGPELIGDEQRQLQAVITWHRHDRS